MSWDLKAKDRTTLSSIDVKTGKNGDLNISQFLPTYAQLSAAGLVFAAETGAGTAKAPVAAPPTTTATWALYNANTTAHLVIIKATSYMISGTAGLGGALLGTVCVGDQTAVTANYSGAIVSCLDGTAKKPNAFISNAVTLVGTQSAWVPLDNGDLLAVVSVGAGITALVHGLMVVPPKGSAGFATLAPVGTTALFAFCVVFAEVNLNLA